MNTNKLRVLQGKITQMGFYPFIRESDGIPQLYVSAEHGDGAADYYGEFRGGYPWIDPKLEKLAEDAGCYWEWQNPGCIVLAD